MPRNEEGEFELVLGNRQLLSVFFIVVVLLGVFFTMGYIVGRNSGPAPEVARRVDAAAPAPIVVDPTKPEPPKPERVEPPPPKPAEPPPPVVKEPEKKAAPPPAPAVSAGGVSEPAKGTYLQVMAVARGDAELMVNLLRKKGFPALLAPGPSETIVRVVVGPLADAAAVAKTKADLQEAGFKGTIVKRY